MNENEALNWNINHQIIKIKFTLNKIWNWQQLAACSATEHNPGDRKAIPADEGAAEVPADSVATHKIERPETHD